MSLLVDTGVWFAYLHEDDKHNQEAEAIVAACMDGRHGQVLTTLDIVGETLTLLLSRGAPSHIVTEFATFVGMGSREDDPQLATIVDGGRAPSRAAWGVFERHYEDKSLSFTDCTSIVTMRRRGIDAIASFDDDFDGLVERVAE